MTTHPFEIGTQVVIFRNSGWGEETAHLAKVKKFYKNGNFVLDDGSTQQWSPSASGHASQTGDAYYRSQLRIATPEVLEKAAKCALRERWRKAAYAIGVLSGSKLPDVTEEAVIAIEKAANAIKPKVTA